MIAGVIFLKNNLFLNSWRRGVRSGGRIFILFPFFFFFFAFSVYQFGEEASALAGADSNRYHIHTLCV